MVETQVPVTNQRFKMDSKLKSNLTSIAYNCMNDWDFILPISGTAKTRVGKTFIGSQVGYFFAQLLGTPFSIENYVFYGSQLMKKAHKFPKHSVFVYDEARGQLDSKKSLQFINQSLFDFFSECGVYNHIVIVILPDFFELKKTLAIGRSICLINVFYRKEKVKWKGSTVQKFRRGYFQFYDDRGKKHLYIQGKKRFDDYSVGRPRFIGRFPNHFTVDKEKYDEIKLRFVKRDRVERSRFIQQRDNLIKCLVDQKIINQTQLSKILSNTTTPLSQRSISYIMEKPTNKQLEEEY